MTGELAIRLGRIGGLLIVGGGALFAVAVANYLNGGGVGFGRGDASALVVDLSLVLFAGGAALLAVAGPRPLLHGRVARVGLATLAVGQISLLALSMAAASFTVEGLERLGPPIFGTALLGSLLTGLGLVTRHGPARAVGSLFLAGVALTAVVTILGIERMWVPPAHTVLAAMGLAVLGNVGVGVLAITGSRSALIESDHRDLPRRRASPGDRAAPSPGIEKGQQQAIAREHNVWA